MSTLLTILQVVLPCASVLAVILAASSYSNLVTLPSASVMAVGGSGVVPVRIIGKAFKRSVWICGFCHVAKAVIFIGLTLLA